MMTSPSLHQFVHCNFYCTFPKTFKWKTQSLIQLHNQDETTRRLWISRTKLFHSETVGLDLDGTNRTCCLPFTTGLTFASILRLLALYFLLFLNTAHGLMHNRNLVATDRNSGTKADGKSELGSIDAILSTLGTKSTFGMIYKMISQVYEHFYLLKASSTRIDNRASLPPEASSSFLMPLCCTKRSRPCCKAWAPLSALN